MTEQEEFEFRHRLEQERAKPKKKEEAPNPTAGMSTVERAVAGYGKAAMDMYRGLRQFDGLINPASRFYNEATNLQGQIDQAKQDDAPLMKTGAGFAGNIAGNVVNALPTAFIPGANTIGGSALIGGITGAVQPVASDESRLANTALGAAIAPVATVVGRGVNALYQGGKALLEPFSQSGRDQIAGRVLERFADNANGLRNLSSAPTITGARPTLAEQTGDAGLARLQDALRAVDPQINNQIGGRLAENNAARVNALNKLTGADGARDFAVANRAGTAGPMYDDAFKVAIDASKLTPAEKAQMTILMRSPDIKAAMKDAQTNLANKGGNPQSAAGRIEGLHEIKMVLDDRIAKAVAENGGAAGARADALKALQSRLVTFIEKMSPEYANARGVYAQMSQPINSMDIAAEVAKRGLSKGTDLSGNQTINRNAFLGALNDENLVKRATGRTLGNDLSKIMSPDDLNLLRTIGAEADRAGAVAAAGNGPGSATAQRMASQNVLRQVIGPTGLPESWAENALANTILGKPLNLVYGGVAEPRIQQALAQAVLDPAQAQAVLTAARQQGIQLPPSTLQLLTTQAARLSAPAAAIPGQR